MILFSGWNNECVCVFYLGAATSRDSHVKSRGCDLERLIHVKSETRTCKEREYAHIGIENLHMQARSVRRLGSIPGHPGER